MVTYNVTTVYDVTTTNKYIEPPFEFDLSAGNLLTKNFKGFTYQAFPAEKGKVFIRLENLLDDFDNHTDTKYVNLVDLSKWMWWEGQSMHEEGLKVPTPEIKEVNNDGSALSEKSSHGWSGITTKAYQKDINGYKGVALEPMRIRSFIVDFSQVAKVAAASPKQSLVQAGSQT